MSCLHSSEFLEFQPLMEPTSRELQLLLHEPDRKVLWIFRYIYVVYELLVSCCMNSFTHDTVNLVQNAIIANKTLDTFVVNLLRKIKE